MNQTDPWRLAEEAARVVGRAVGTEAKPGIAVVLGSGLGSIADRVENPAVVPYEEIPHFPKPTVSGHAGRLISGRFGRRPVLVFQGRFHYYEGHDLETVVSPIRLARLLGVDTIVLTAACGAIREGLRPGDIVCISDHINFLFENPLRGTNAERFGPRFPDLSNVYSPGLRSLAVDAACSLGFALQTGVYGCMPGPSYETPAEIRMLKTLGVDIVGMSTVPEAIAARHAGMDVLAFALVANLAAGIAEGPISHAEVLAAGQKAQAAVGNLIEAVLEASSNSRI